MESAKFSDAQLSVKEFSLIGAKVIDVILDTVEDHILAGAFQPVKRPAKGFIGILLY